MTSVKMKFHLVSVLKIIKQREYEPDTVLAPTSPSGRPQPDCDGCWLEKKERRYIGHNN